ncbi:SWI/SNF-related matrix-associated actin-dependent regulator of chromatin [Plasmodium brasilianum]|uniref:SWIB/MDM2 domain-containing protein, putative n=2 Tax=Plasmodium (Plasmodium) TaxID=418103 RepID=A0A1A8W6N8_PLAMA|nr:SWIB/MDM2 domain-containing protein, putative [Plasmodium malariae]KAI4837378.1 SWI/SNF-related matrix-associated actin-dependent regulator of chromatin [Plasmodium brasilianum]SBS87348.1 conserved Plasmodium protein, unknown function [Plasmodium malariae]SCO93264.1 SWIB/MDM2 domain-containing protein, putative [Plasmodium malariae]
MEPVDDLDSISVYDDSEYKKDYVIRDLLREVITSSIKEIDGKSINLLETLMKYGYELNRCIDKSNYYINEAFSSRVNTEKLRRKLRVHVFTVFNDGDRELSYPANITVEDSANVYRNASPSSMTFNIQGYILDADESDYDDVDESERLPTRVMNERRNSGYFIEDDDEDEEGSEMINEEVVSKYSGTDIDEDCENNENIDYRNTSVMKFTSFFSTIMVMRENETIVYDKKYKNYYDCDKLTFTRTLSERRNEIIKVYLFLDQKTPFFELSKKLSIFMKSPEETIPEIMKRIYEYCLEKDLVDSISAKIKTDEKLKDILGVDECEFSDLPKLLQKNFVIQKPIVLEHIVDLENEDESESIYDIVVDIFEPFVTLDSGKRKKFVLDSHHLNDVLQFLKKHEINEEENEDTLNEDSIKECTCTTNNLCSRDNNRLDENVYPADVRNNLLNVNGGDIVNENAEEENMELEDVEENYDKKDYINSGRIITVLTEKGDIEEYLIKECSEFCKKYKNLNLNSVGVTIFEKMNGLQSEIESIDDDIINILCKIRKKNNLRLRYTRFYEDPCGFIEHVMNSKFPVDFENLDDNIDYIYDQAANINDDNYYKLPWVHRGISKYLLIKDKNLDDVLKSFLNSMNLESKRKISSRSSNGNKKQRVPLNEQNNYCPYNDSNSNNNYSNNNNNNYYDNNNNNSNANNDNNMNNMLNMNSMLNMNNMYNMNNLYNMNNMQNVSNMQNINNNNSNINNNNLCYYYDNNNMNYSTPDPFNISMQNYGNNINYESNNMQNSGGFQMNNNTNDNEVRLNMNAENNFMQNNEQVNFNAYNINQVAAYPTYMNFPFNMTSQNDFNAMYNGTLPMELYPNENFYNSGNFAP